MLAKSFSSSKIFLFFTRFKKWQLTRFEMTIEEREREKNDWNEILKREKAFINYYL